MEVLWSNLDPNFHVRHSVYYDWGASAGLSFLIEKGLGPKILLNHNIGPVFLREECVFKREIHYEDEIEIQSCFLKFKPDISRWTIQHEIWKNKDALCAVITTDCAWINTQSRRLAILPSSLQHNMEANEYLAATII